ncbi:hypothetical protein Krad_4582 (plasmid) [Kineococcus radiotolerans SRS30216 = ATCC BAA-149]|uniref:Uncharacterized protein n=1 Tax=Kineococcus radiotolerans (strain ATCC BAA-149 / DSM 14245 / SRS30216) TaxID=266940 RepID=A6WGV2_KINRD|nr:hypothetical protein Krad_4582 [Kineococcus radiotolerans SRS30216 = ATCC BAA-149]
MKTLQPPALEPRLRYRRRGPTSRVPCTKVFSSRGVQQARRPAAVWPPIY